MIEKVESDEWGWSKRRNGYFSILLLVEVEAKLEGESENGYIVYFG